jgi:hypothetical protein
MWDFIEHCWPIYAVMGIVLFVLFRLIDKVTGPLEKARAKRIAQQAERIVDKYAPDLTGQERAEAVEQVREATEAGLKSIIFKRGNGIVEIKVEYESEASQKLKDLRDVVGGVKEMGAFQKK